MTKLIPPSQKDYELRGYELIQCAEVVRDVEGQVRTYMAATYELNMLRELLSLESILQGLLETGEMLDNAILKLGTLERKT